MQRFYRSLVFYLILIFYNLPAHSQLPANPLGNHPLRLKWNQIETDKVRLIFPEGMGTKAQRLANIIHYMAEQNTATLPGDPPKVPIVLHNLTVIPNGFVTVGPFRSEFFMISPQFDCTTDWMESLVIHEYRHVMQFGHNTQGITKTVKDVLGSWAWGGMMATALPRWYFEGDAVVFESALTRSGRGRLPAFQMEYKSLILDGVDYGYEKASAGSLKDFVPDWYRLGEAMIRYSRNEFGPDMLEEVVSDAVRYKGLFYPFSKSLKKRTGLSTPGLYDATMSSMKREYLSESQPKQRLPAEKFNPDGISSSVTNYNLPLVLESGELLVLKSCYHELPAIVKIRDNYEEKITEPGILLDLPMTTLSESNGTLCWAALDFSIRRRFENFNNIYSYDLVTGVRKQLTSGKRYFSPALSKDGKRIAAVEIDSQGNAYLEILDAQSGRSIEKINNPGQVFYSYPQWSSDGRSIIVVSRSNEMHSLIQVNINSHTENVIISPVYHQISHPYIRGDTVYFSMGYEGTNNIFACSLIDRRTYQLTDVVTGAFQPHVSKGNQLYYSQFASNGYELYGVPLSLSLWKPVTLHKYSDDSEEIEVLAAQEGGPILSEVPQHEFEVKDFNKWSGIINPHSLIPILDHPLAGLQVLSDNTFSTLSAQAGLFYQYNEDEWRYEIGLNYAELFPVIHTSYGRYSRSAVLRNFQTTSDTTAIHTIFSERWQENRLSVGTSIPLNFSKGNYSNQMTLGFFYRNIGLDSDRRFDDPDHYRKDTITFDPNLLSQFRDIEKAVFNQQNLHAVDFIFDYRSFKRRAFQHILPRWGWQVGFRYRSTLFGDDIAAGVWLADANVFFPGLTRNHHLYFNLMAQGENVLDNYRFSDQFDYPRGYDLTLLRDEYYKIGVNYAFPLWYPDVALGAMAFVKRIKANLFADAAWIRIKEFPFQPNTDVMRSAGVEFTFDFRALRLLEVDLGFRYSYLFDGDFHDGNPHQFNFLLLRISDR